MHQLTKREYTLARTLVRLGHIHRLPIAVRCTMELVAEAAQGSDKLAQRAYWAKIYADCGDPQAGAKALRSCPLVGSGVPPGSLMFGPLLPREYHLAYGVSQKITAEFVLAQAPALSESWPDVTSGSLPKGFYETALGLPYQEAPTLDYSAIEALVLPYLVTEVTVEGWTIGINMPERRGWFERDRDGKGGGLLFYAGDAVELADYDGTVALPSPVFNQLKAWGVVMEDTFDPDYEVQP